MIRFAPCKINLGLHVISKRADGYHNLETCFYPVPWYDIVEVIPSQRTQFTISGSTIPGDTTANLCLRAYELLQPVYTLPAVSIHLHKVIPTGAGLGGGSSDGAHVLRALNDLFELNLSQTELCLLAEKLGSDCPFFLFDEPMMGTGRGEILRPAPVSLTGYFLVVVKPPIHVSTAEAYRGIVPKMPAFSLREILAEPVTTWRQRLVNDFEHSVFSKYPELEEIKNNLYDLGACYAAMSGSGSAVFGIFTTPVALHDQFNAATFWAGELSS